MFYVNCTFKFNCAYYEPLGEDAFTNSGGAISSYGSTGVMVYNCTFLRNVANRGGAIDAQEGADQHIVNCVFNYNTASSYGGAVWAHGSGQYPPDYCNLFIDDCTFWDNAGDNCGGNVDIDDLFAVLADWSCGEAVASDPPQSIMDCILMYASDPEDLATCIEAIQLTGGQ